MQIICALNKPARDIPNQPTFKVGIATCGEGTFMIPETVNSVTEITYLRN
ncbi:hypothetical protein [Nostoc sp. T09]|nr:hypothetical protein [Nostoc sp. T09]